MIGLQLFKYGHDGDYTIVYYYYPWNYYCFLVPTIQR